MVEDIIFVPPAATVFSIEVSFCDSLPGEVAIAEVMCLVAKLGRAEVGDDGGETLELLLADVSRGVCRLGDLDEEDVVEENEEEASPKGKTGGGVGEGRRVKASSGSS